MKQMKHLTIVLLSLALVFSIAWAESESLLLTVFDSLADLAFATTNVTVDGEAVFSFDGVRFKTAKLHYVQDEYDSLYDLELLTPRKSGEKSTGWIIVANGEDIYVIERYTPGVYRTGTDDAQNTLVRGTAMLEPLVTLGRTVAAAAESLLPAGAVTETGADGARTIRLAFTEDNVPDILNAALNVAAQYLLPRWYDRIYFDRESSDRGAALMEDYISTASAVADNARSYTLKMIDASVTLDADGRVTAVSGTAVFVVEFLNGTTHSLEVTLQAEIGQYGTSTVDTFDPAAYNVVLPAGYYGEDTDAMGSEFGIAEADTAAVEAAEARARELWLEQGITVPDSVDTTVYIEDEGDTVQFDLTDTLSLHTFHAPDGELILMQQIGPWLNLDEEDVTGVDESVLLEAETRAMSFLAGMNPSMAEIVGALHVTSMIRDGENLYLRLDDEDLNVTIILQVGPEWQVLYYSVVSNG